MSGQVHADGVCRPFKLGVSGGDSEADWEEKQRGRVGQVPRCFYCFYSCNNVTAGWCSFPREPRQTDRLSSPSGAACSTWLDLNFLQTGLEPSSPSAQSSPLVNTASFIRFHRLLAQRCEVPQCKRNHLDPRARLLHPQRPLGDLEMRNIAGTKSSGVCPRSRDPSHRCPSHILPSRPPFLGCQVRLPPH